MLRSWPPGPGSRQVWEAEARAGLTSQGVSPAGQQGTRPRLGSSVPGPVTGLSWPRSRAHDLFPVRARSPFLRIPARPTCGWPETATASSSVPAPGCPPLTSQDSTQITRVSVRSPGSAGWAARGQLSCLAEDWKGRLPVFPTCPPPPTSMFA